MSEHQNEDDTTPLEYFISGLVVLLFGLLYFFLNHGKDFMSGADNAALSLAAPAAVATTESELTNKLLADNSATAEMPSAAVDTAETEKQKPATEGEAQTEAEQAQQQQLVAEKAEREQADKERMAAEQALRDQLAAERQRADEATRKLAESQKLLAAEKARQAEAARESSSQPTPARQRAATAEPDAAESEATAEASDNTQQAGSQAEEPVVYRLPDGTEIPVADEGFEGAVKAAMTKPAEAADNVALMNEPMLFDDISFESGSAQLSSNSQQQIRALAALMNTYQDKKILIRGHTDNVGGVNANSLLSLTRSDSMKKQLVGLGIEQTRIKIEGVGQLEPLASNDTAEGRSRNRRIELILIK